MINDVYCADINKLIKASTPEAKGRVERSYQTIQDRIVPELRLMGIKSQLGANQYLQQHFIPKYWQQRIVVEARQPENRFRQLDPTKNLDEMFCYKYDRHVKRDQTFYWQNETYKIDDKTQGNLWNKVVVIHEDQGGKIKVYYSGKQLKVEKIVRHRYQGQRRSS